MRKRAAKTKALVKKTVREYIDVFKELLQAREQNMTTKKSRVRAVSKEESRAIPDEEIRQLAYLKWEKAQPSPKSSNEFWVEAEQELNGAT